MLPRQRGLSGHVMCFSEGMIFQADSTYKIYGVFDPEEEEMISDCSTKSHLLIN